MKNVLIAMLVLPASVNAAEVDNRVETYLEFESAYMSNNVQKFEPWLAKGYEVKQTLHIPGVGADTRPVTKRQLLSSMKAVGKPSLVPRSEPDAVEITSSKKGFCGASRTTNETTVSGETYQEVEIRQVCFEQSKGAYKAYKHTIDVHFTKI